MKRFCQLILVQNMTVVAVMGSSFITRMITARKDCESWLIMQGVPGSLEAEAQQSVKMTWTRIWTLTWPQIRLSVVDSYNESRFLLCAYLLAIALSYVMI